MSLKGKLVLKTLPLVRRFGYRDSYFGWRPCIIRPNSVEGDVSG